MPKRPDMPKEVLVDMIRYMQEPGQQPLGMWLGWCQPSEDDVVKLTTVSNPLTNVEYEVFRPFRRLSVLERRLYRFAVMWVNTYTPGHNWSCMYMEYLWYSRFSRARNASTTADELYWHCHRELQRTQRQNAVSDDLLNWCQERGVELLYGCSTVDLADDPDDEQATVLAYSMQELQEAWTTDNWPIAIENASDAPESVRAFLASELGRTVQLDLPMEVT